MTASSLCSATGRAKVSGLETEIRYAVIYTLRAGKIVRGREYIDRKQALEAVGCGSRPPAAESIGERLTRVPPPVDGPGGVGPHGLAWPYLFGPIAMEVEE